MQLVIKEEIDGIISTDSFKKSLGIELQDQSFNYQIEEPTDPAYGVLATNFAFIFSKKLKELKLRPVSPDEIARIVAAEISVEKFQATVDGGGFINFRPTPRFCAKFFSAPKSLSLEEVNIQWDSKAVWDNFFSPLPDELPEFVIELKKRGSLTLTRSDSLQLLSLIGDPELDASAYFSGYGSRTNTPFYLNKFFEVLNELKKHEGEIEVIPPELETFSQALLLFRGRVISAAKRNHPDRVLSLTLSLVREFFGAYNRPGIRAELNHFHPVLKLAELAGNYSHQTLGALKFSCELPSAVL